jgi:hypothetical protein
MTNVGTYSIVRGGQIKHGQIQRGQNIQRSYWVRETLNKWGLYGDKLREKKVVLDGTIVYRELLIADYLLIRVLLTQGRFRNKITWTVIKI